MGKRIVSIKGTPTGLLFSFDTTEVGFGQIYADLEEQLISSGDYYEDAEYVLENENQLAAEDIKSIEELLAKYHLHRGSLAPRMVPTDEEMEVTYQTAGGNSILLTKSIRSGQKLYIRGNAIVMGDINPGGEIVATGNIIVMGNCRGVLHAGAEGDEQAYIVVYQMKAQQIRIASHVATVPEEVWKTPLKAAIIRDGGIVLTDYLPAQFADLPAAEAETAPAAGAGGLDS